MKALSNELSSRNLQPKGQQNNYYLWAMLLLTLLLAGVAYYDKFVTGLIN